MTERLFVIPLDNIPQEFNITLGGRQLTMVSKWNEYCGWLLDIYDAADKSPLSMAIPLVTGCDIIGQLPQLGIPASLIVYTDGDQDAEPTQTSLGRESNLYALVDIA